MPAGPINNIQQSFDEPQAQHRGLATTITGPDGLDIPSVASPLRLGLTPASNRLAVPRLGEHSHMVLKNVLGFSDKKLATLEANAVIQS